MYQESFMTDKLRSLLNRNDGFAATNRWFIELPNLQRHRKVNGDSIGPYSMEDLNLFATNVRMPGFQVRSVERPEGIVSKRVAVGYEPGTANLTFYLNHNYTPRRYFQDWIETIVSSTPPYEMGFFDDYKADITVHQLDKMGNSRYALKMIECYPSNIAEIELNNAVQTAALEMTVTILYKYYEKVPMLPNDF